MLQHCNYDRGMTETRWWRYLQGLMGTQTQQEAAEKIGISKSNITRWKAGARADPDFVVKVARAYKANVLEALVASGFITEQEAALTELMPRMDLKVVSADELADEVRRRARLVEASGQDELAARRAAVSQSNNQGHPRPHHEHDGTVRDYQPHLAAADNSPDEDQLREEAGADPLD